MKKRPILLSALAALTLGANMAIPAYAASENECAIWLCAPAGFPGGCEQAHKAMLKRLKKLKPPLPAFASCVAKEETQQQGSQDNFSFTFERVLRINRYGEISYISGEKCREKTGPGEYNEVPFCEKALRVIKVFQNGQLIGEPYYF